jgi:methane/ammonia monooxygenase subunit B
VRTRFWRGVLVFVFAAAATSWAKSAFAHGEAADEPFLKDLTVAFYDVHVSPTTVKVGEPVTVTGSVKILPTWPFTLDPPQTAYINAVVPGPVFALRDRTINGVPAIGSIAVDRNGIYNFKLVLLGRIPGRWHVHPGFAVDGTGTLIGPGQWVTVEPSETPFTYKVTLLNGKTVDLEHVGGSGVWWWSFVGFLVGVVWMFYWTVPGPWRPDRRTVHNLAVTAQLPTWDQGRDFGLVTDGDHKASTFIAAVTLAMLVVGWLYMVSAYPVRIKQQTDRFTPPQPEVTEMGQVKALGSIYDPSTHTLTLNLEVKNTTSTPITIKQFTMGLMSFVNGDKEALEKAGPSDFVAPMQVAQGNATIAPGQTEKVTLKMSSEMMEEERLIPLNDPQEIIAGLLFVQDPSGNTSSMTVRSTLTPTEFSIKYL